MVSLSFKWTGFRPVLQDTILEFPYFSINSTKGILYLEILDKGSKMRKYIHVSVQTHTFVIRGCYVQINVGIF